jgi:hypothetical protein
LIGGVIAHHPYLKVLLTEKFNKNIQIIENPQYVVSLGAAIIALKNFEKIKVEEQEMTKQSEDSVLVAEIKQDDNKIKK